MIRPLTMLVMLSSTFSINQAVVDNAEDQDACQNTGYAADTAGVGGAAYGSRSDSVQLVVQAELAGSAEPARPASRIPATAAQTEHHT